MTFGCRIEIRNPDCQILLSVAKIDDHPCFVSSSVVKIPYQNGLTALEVDDKSQTYGLSFFAPNSLGTQPAETLLMSIDNHARYRELVYLFLGVQIVIRLSSFSSSEVFTTSFYKKNNIAL